MSTNSHLGATAYPEDVCMIALQTVCTDAEVSAALTRDENKFDEATRKADRELVLNFVHGIMLFSPSRRSRAFSTGTGMSSQKATRGVLSRGHSLLLRAGID